MRCTIGKQVKDYDPAEMWTWKNGVRTFEGFSLVYGIGSGTIEHDPSPPLGLTDWNTLRNAQDMSAFDTAASSSWGVWWSPKSSIDRTRIYEVMGRTKVGAAGAPTA